MSDEKIKHLELLFDQLSNWSVGIDLHIGELEKKFEDNNTYNLALEADANTNRNDQRISELEASSASHTEKLDVLIDQINKNCANKTHIEGINYEIAELKQKFGSHEEDHLCDIYSKDNTFDEFLIWIGNNREDINELKEMLNKTDEVLKSMREVLGIE